jgi:hypothetical protein
MSTTLTTHPQPARTRTIAALLARRRPITRRALQVALGVLWLLDGVLQAQPFMFTRGFARQLIAPVGQGQPGVVSGPVHLASVVIAANPVAWNLLAAGIQLLLGIGLLVGRTARLALLASIGWALGVWYMGEGLSGLASGHASLLTGAPGSALLYAILAAAAWPTRTSEQAPASWLAPAWALLWVSSAGWQLLPGQNGGPALAGLLTGAAGGAPHWLASLDTSVGNWASQNGTLAVSALAATFYLVGIGALSRRTRAWAATAGLALSIPIWVIGQDLGQLYSGRATDPNSAPLIALMAVALLARSHVSPARRRYPQESNATHRTTGESMQATQLATKGLEERPYEGGTLQPQYSLIERDVEREIRPPASLELTTEDIAEIEEDR